MIDARLRRGSLRREFRLRGRTRITNCNDRRANRTGGGRRDRDVDQVESGFRHSYTHGPPSSPLSSPCIINHQSRRHQSLLRYNLIDPLTFPSIRTAHEAALLTVINPVNVAASIRLLALARRSHTRQSLGRGSLEREMEIFPSRRDRFVQIFLKFEES